MTDLSLFFIDREIDSINRLTNIDESKKRLLNNINKLEALLIKYKNNKKLQTYAAQATYSYAFSFIEDFNQLEAIDLYYKAYNHGKSALGLYGVSHNDLLGSPIKLRNKVKKLPDDAIGALYWTAISWAKLIQIKQPNLALLTQIYKTTILMDEVLERDSNYQLGGAYLFFAVYFAGRPEYMGRNINLASKYFDRAREINNDRLLLVDYLQTKYLDNQNPLYEQRLLNIIKARDDLYIEQGLINAIAKYKANHLLLNIHSDHLYSK